MLGCSRQTRQGRPNGAMRRAKRAHQPRPPTCGAACCCDAAPPPPLPGCPAPPPSAPSQTACGRGPGLTAPSAGPAWTPLPALPGQTAAAAWHSPSLLHQGRGSAPCPGSAPQGHAPAGVADCLHEAIRPDPSPCACPAKRQQASQKHKKSGKHRAGWGQLAALLCNNQGQDIKRPPKGESIVLHA